MKYLKTVLLVGFVAALLGSVTLTGIYFYMKPDLPSVAILKDVRLQTPMRIYTHDGKLISQYGVKRRIPVTLDETPELLQKAILATEDSRFYKHFGIDPIGITRAFINLVLTGEKSQGASTLTQQLARGFFLTREKTYIRKIKEVFIALHMEAELSKDEIFELYLNKIELGHRSFGFGAAAQVYYGKKLNELSLAQIATLAGLPQAPSVLNPISRPERSLERRRIVLLRMLDEGFITKAQFNEANSAPVTAKKHGAEIELDAPYLADLIYSEMVNLYGKEEAETGGYQVYATASSTLQQAAQHAVKQNLHDYDERHGYRGAVARLWPLQANNDNAAKGEAKAEEECAAQPLYVNWPCDIDENDVNDALANIGAYGFVRPVVVTSVDEKTFITRDSAGTERTIEWQGMDWARPYIHDSRQGQPPDTASDIVAAGDIVYIREQDDLWRLAQLPDASGALVALDPNNGAVQAIVGGYSFYESQFNRATQAKRQVGSNIKPFVYSAALENGYTIASVINDAPINEWDEATGVAWRPQNSPAEYDGPIRMRIALGKSKNVVSVRLLRGVGLDNTIEHLTRFGLDKADISRDETVSLGSSSHTPLEVVRGMATIANGGFLIQPYFIDRVLDENGRMLWQHTPSLACDNVDCDEARQQAFAESSGAANAEADAEADVEAMLAAELNQSVQSEPENTPLAPRVISAQNAFLVADMMRTAVRVNGSWTDWRGTGWRASLILKRDDLAGKTGTTNDSRDAWFSGFNRKLVATAWVGFDDMNRQLGRTTYNQPLAARDPERFSWIGNAMIGTESGAMAAQPAWIRFMQTALNDVPEAPMPVPADIVRVRIDRTSGKLTRRTDDTTLFEYFLRGTQPTVYVLDDELDDSTGEDKTNVDVDDIF
ncbi:penicillin-binding protein 1A [Alteromonas gilva]|uniref:Penicillin-binding protein 1A n=1 Tax=Alteromonas gilva TaxID=2987522 RepID=A0ABT5L508_9ALTE|nr:penicillin-binding protein 1A [Alteromonas gilva]MDC8832124.1 penicillin-binding protein 1A [Alteromonas gilva]